jgi:hypothetical protein
MSGARDQLAIEAFVYGYPLVEQTRTLFAGAEGKGPFAAPVNTFKHVRVVLDAKMARELGIVSPNNDTLYTIATVDVGPEPVVLRVPEVHDRYYVLQFIDAWTNNFAYVGQRTIGDRGGEFLLAPPGWSGEAPGGMPVISAPTRLFVIGGRFLVNGADDIPNVAAAQDGLALIPLSTYPELPDLASRAAGDWPLPQPDASVPESLVFWERLRTFMRAYRPHADDLAYQERFEPLGLLADESPYPDADSELRAALQAGEEAGRAHIEEQSKTALPLRNQWQAVAELFNYNTHFLELGTLDTPEWKIDDPERSRLVRAIAARIGIGGNHAYEAFYPITFLDADGDELSGDNRYVLHFDQPPPVDGFWSLTMYDVPKFLFVDNPLDRYSIGDRTEGLRTNDDGSLDLYLQHDPPEPDQQPNWLPAPGGLFRPILRMYNPRPEAFDEARWHLPAIQKLA